MISLGPDLCSCILHRPDPSLLFRGPDLRRGFLRDLQGILHGLYRGSLRGLCGLGLCSRLFLCRPSLELLEQCLQLGGWSTSAWV